jgi:hypothetical protein
VFNGYHERKFPERAALLAEEIEATHPDVVGLQEAVMVRTDTPADGPAPPATPAEQVSLDYLQILLAKLQALGLNYTPVVESNNWNIEVPADKDSPPNGPDFDLRHTDRIATLIRTDQNSDLKVLRTNSAHFKSTSNCKLPTATGQQIEIVRGWTSVDLSIRGKAVRLINTHLDGDCIAPQAKLHFSTGPGSGNSPGPGEGGAGSGPSGNPSRRSKLRSRRKRDSDLRQPA